MVVYSLQWVQAPIMLPQNVNLIMSLGTCLLWAGQSNKIYWRSGHALSSNEQHQALAFWYIQAVASVNVHQGVCLHAEAGSKSCFNAMSAMVRLLAMSFCQWCLPYSTVMVRDPQACHELSGLYAIDRGDVAKDCWLLPYSHWLGCLPSW